MCMIEKGVYPPDATKESEGIARRELLPIAIGLLRANRPDRKSPVAVQPLIGETLPTESVSSTPTTPSLHYHYDFQYHDYHGY